MALPKVATAENLDGKVVDFLPSLALHGAMQHVIPLCSEIQLSSIIIIASLRLLLHKRSFVEVFLENSMN